MNPTAGLWIRRAICLPMVLYSYAIILVVRAAWGDTLWWQDGVLFTRLRAGTWPTQTWYSKWMGTCFGHSIMLAPSADAKIVKHELRHVEQAEASSAVGLFLTLALGWPVGWPALCLWALLPLLGYLGGMLTAVLRGEDPYRGNHLEEAAYDHTARK
jgi:hypothetical protein